MEVITSKNNETIKKIKKLKDKKYRNEQNSFIVEGIKMIKEAIEENADIKSIIICEDCVKSGLLDKKLLYSIASYECIYVSQAVFESITEVVSPQGILAVIGKDNKKSIVDISQDLILILDGIQDPGNLGTILRTADSAGLNQIIVSKKTVDAYSPKVVRSTMGAIYRINIIEVEDLEKSIKDIKKKGYKILATSLDTDESIYDIDFIKKAVIIGNEANGVSQNIQDISDKKIKIPMLGKTESLNASVATGIVIYEYVRQKIEKTK